MKRYLFELSAVMRDGVVERRSTWISDQWLEEQLAHDPSLDRIVEVPEGDHHPLPDWRIRN